MEKDKISQIVQSLVGLKAYEWQAIERAVNKEFASMSNRLELTDITRIQKNIEREIIH